MNGPQKKTWSGGGQWAVGAGSDRIDPQSGIRSTLPARGEAVLRSGCTARQECQGEWGSKRNSAISEGARMVEYVDPQCRPGGAPGRRPGGQDAAGRQATLFPFRSYALAARLRLVEARCQAGLIRRRGLDQRRADAGRGSNIGGTSNLESSPSRRFLNTRHGCITIGFAPATGLKESLARMFYTRHGCISGVFRDFCAPVAGHLYRFTICGGSNGRRG